MHSKGASTAAPVVAAQTMAAARRAPATHEARPRVGGSGGDGVHARIRIVDLLNYVAGSVILFVALSAVRTRMNENAVKTVALGGGQSLPAGYQIATEEEGEGVGRSEQWSATGAGGDATYFHNSL